MALGSWWRARVTTRFAHWFGPVVRVNRERKTQPDAGRFPARASAPDMATSVSRGARLRGTARRARRPFRPRSSARVVAGPDLSVGIAPAPLPGGTRLDDRALPTAVGVLVVTDLVGGLLAVGTGVNTWSQAWGSAALLAAPAPMIMAQVALTWLAVRLPGRWQVLPAALLALACLISVVSGFFDGGLANERLSAGLIASQVFLLGVTGVVGVLAAARAARVLRRAGQTVATAAR